LAARRLSQQIKDLVEALDMHLGLIMVLFEGGAELVRIGSLRHLGQSLQYLLFGVIDVLQRIREQFVEVLLSHRALLRFGEENTVETTSSPPLRGVADLLLQRLLSVPPGFLEPRPPHPGQPPAAAPKFRYPRRRLRPLACRR